MQVVGDVRLQDRPQLLGVRVPEGDLVQQPAGRLAQLRHVRGQGLDGVPVVDEARTAIVVAVLQAVV
ncbi:hypothetical protein [Streptomyces sp. IBSBF 2390]|uniref:hypothetical protein n=1 Tax=Streptomyces sp. IBSBF 2390 TaxID=2903533 RepID=UPI002FDB993B